MVSGITWEEDTLARAQEARAKQKQALGIIAEKQTEAKTLADYAEVLEKAVALAREQKAVTLKGTVHMFDPEHLRAQSTWNSLLELISRNNGLLVVLDAVAMLVDAKVFRDREHARNVIYSTLYAHKNDINKVRAGMYRLKDMKEATKQFVLQDNLNNPMSFDKGVSKVLRDANGEALHRTEIWRRMQLIGIKSNAKKPEEWIDWSAKNLKAEKVASHVWRWPDSQTNSPIAK